MDETETNKARQAAETIHERLYPHVPFGDFWRGFTAALLWKAEEDKKAR